MGHRAARAIDGAAGGYAATGARWPTLLLVGLLHAGALAALLTARSGFVHPVPAELTTFDVALAPPPPAPPEPAPEPVVTADPPPVVAPPPIVRVDHPAPPIRTTPEPPIAPPPPIPLAMAGPPAPGPAAPSAAAPAVASVGDLSSGMISATPPRYPYESRRRCEQGTVSLAAVLTVHGHVGNLSVRRSSGHPRLDRAAIDAVRRWRWSPTMRDGVAVPVRGHVDLPFELSDAAAKC